MLSGGNGPNDALSSCVGQILTDTQAYPVAEKVRRNIS
jgi:hypothetical protein